MFSWAFITASYGTFTMVKSVLNMSDIYIIFAANNRSVGIFKIPLNNGYMTPNKSIAVAIAIIICKEMLILNILFLFSSTPSPSAYDIKRCVALASVEFKKPSNPIAPPTTLKIPKSEAPNDANINRVVYNDTNIVIPILTYRKPVFFITRIEVDITLS